MELMKFEYLVQSVHIFFPGEKYVSITPTQVSGFNVYKDYDKCFFPVLNLSLATNPELAYKIIEYKDVVEIQLRVQYRRKDEDNSPVMGYTKDLFNERFSVYIEDEAPNLDKETLKETRQIDQAGGASSSYDYSSVVDLFLFKKSDMEASRRKINMIGKDVDLSTFALYILNNVGITKVLMEGFDNNNIIPEVIVPPFNTIQAFKYLENQFGFYKTWSLLFFDFTRTYLISKRGRVNAHVTNELAKCTLNVGSNMTKEFLNGGMYLERTQYSINITKDSISFGNASVVTDNTIGNNMISIDAKSGEVHRDDAHTIQTGKGNYRVVVNKYDNKYARDCEMHMVNELSRTIAISLVDFDESFFRPNVEYVFKFEDNEMNKDKGGLYRLSSIRSTYEKRGENFFITGTFIFKQQR